MKKYFKSLLVTMLVLGLVQSTFAQWTEKYPINVKITPTNAVSIYLRANFGKIGELAAGKLDSLLQDPTKLAKLSAKGIQKLNDLFNDSSMTSDQKAAAFIVAIEEDIGGYISPPQSGLNITVGYSANYDVVRLNWDRLKVRNYCQVETCSCPDGTKVLSGFFCNYKQVVGGQVYYYQMPASCTYKTDTVDVEAGYDIFRNGVLIASIAEQRKVSRGVSLSSSYSFFGFLDLKLTAITPPLSNDPAGRAGPFYDYDPHNTSAGTPLSYEVRATAYQCGPGYTNEFMGGAGASASFLVDSNGDGRPDYYPADVYANKKAERPPRKTTQPPNCASNPRACS